MHRLALLCAFLLPAAQEDSARRIQDLLEKLRSDVVVERQKAQEELEALGDAALPALRKVVAETRDAEVQARVRSAVEEIERLGRERLQDSKERQRLLDGNRKEDNLQQEKEPGAVVTGGARFSLRARMRREGLVVRTSITNYLSRHDRFLDDVTFDVVSVTDKEGKELPLERCGRCSPGAILAKEAVEPVRVRVKGSVLWFSPHVVEFPAPANGDRRKLGDFTFDLDWPSIRVTARRPLPKAIWDRVGDEFTYEVKPGVPGFLYDRMGVGVGGGFGGSFTSSSWCGCRDGPKPVTENPKPELLPKFIVKSGSDRPHALDQVAKIKYVFQKPIEEAVDFTLEIAAPKK